jgi:asparagine synthase (glutamine-hydrolysing)
VPSWFVALEDSEASGPAAAALRDRAASVLHHPSGRPWLLGCWPDGTAAFADAGSTRLAVIGQHAVTPGRLAEEAGRVREAADLDRLTASLPGSLHLIASVAGRVRVQGTVTSVRRVFSARVGGAAVAADRADVLAGLLDARPDAQRLALHLLEPHILYPLAGQPIWTEVEVLRPGHYLVLEGGGRRRQVRCWTAPEPVLPMAEGAPALRRALAAAVALRTQEHALVSADLGGLDSTSLCSLAARGNAEVVAYTAASTDPLADDVAWAQRTVAGLGNVEHHVIPAEEMPLPYAGLHELEEPFDEPFSAAVEHQRLLATARRAAARGSRLHLIGFGGDELLYGSLAHLHSLLRSSPRVALGHLRGFAAKYRWPRGRVLRQLSDTRPYSQWLAGVAGTLTEPPPPMQEPLLDWGFSPRLPPWITTAAAETVADLIRAEGAAAEPLAAGRGQHRELEGMRFVSRIARQYEQLAARLGVTVAAPYYDDRVIEAGLAVRPEERITPWRYKPLILEAMRGIVPDQSLARQTKANGSGDSDPGLRRHRAELLALWEDSRMDRLGLIDAAALRDLCTGALPPEWELGGLDQTVACELWLRSLERVTAPG